MPEHTTQNQIIRWLALHPQVRVFRQNTGVARHGKHVVRYGTPGQPDLHGMVAPMGRYFGIEVKSESGRMSQAQKNYREMMLKMGAVHVTARCVEDVWEVFRVEFPDVKWCTPGELL